MTTRRPRPTKVFHLPKGFVVFQGLQRCPFCNKQFGSGPQLCGHLAHCKNARDSLLQVGEMPLDRNPILVMDEDCYDDYLRSLSIDRNDEGEVNFDDDGLSEFYLNFQRLYLSKDRVEFKTGHCVTSTGAMKKSNWSHYLVICKTLEQLTHVTAMEADSVLDLIKFLSRDIGHEIALPSEYRQMIRTVLASTQHRRLTVTKHWIEPPRFLFGEGGGELKGSPFVHYNVMEVIAHLLLDKDVVGETAEHFAVDFEMPMSDGDRVIRDFHTAEYFRLGSNWVRDNIGEHVKFLPIIISTDKTVVGEGTTKTSFPCYISIGNLKIKAMCKDLSTGMLVICQIVNSTSVMHSVLEEVGCRSKSLRVEAITVWRRHLEQQVST